MEKLIKINDEHYVVVDDSEIKENDWIYDLEENVIYLIKKEMLGVFLLSCRKITHSTQPLEQKTNSHSQGFNMKAMSSDVELIFHKIKSLSLSEVQEAIQGYSVEKMAIECSNFYQDPQMIDEYENKQNIIMYKHGFKAHENLVKDKLFTIEDMINCFNAAREMSYKRPEWQHFSHYYEKNLTPKTEWEIKEITSEGRIILNN